MKILDMVKFNNGAAFVVDEMPALTYERMVAPISACKDEYEKFVFAGREFLIGTDENGVLYDVLYHKRESGSKAFGGHEFSLQMKNGGVFKTDGWWWDGGVPVAARMLGIDLGRVTIESQSFLEKCFVFTRMYADMKRFDERLYQPFLKERGEVKLIDYGEYECEMRARRRQNMQKEG